MTAFKIGICQEMGTRVSEYGS